MTEPVRTTSISQKYHADLFCVLLILFNLLYLSSVLASDKLTKAGWIEKVHIYPGDLVMNAKLDTGAKTSSIHAEDVTRFEREGKPWVRFTVIDEHGKSKVLEREVHRIVKIKRHKREPAERPVIFLGICLGDTYRKTEVNLADRSNYEYELLIGRRFMDEHFAIDPSSKFLLHTNCQISPVE